MTAAEADAWPPELVSLYEAERTALTRLAYLITGRLDVAPELVQDAFLACAPRWSTIDSPKAYVRTAVTNRARDHLRRAALDRDRNRSRNEPVIDRPDELWDALGRLNERRRTAIVLRYYEDLPDDEISKVLSCRPATVRSLIHRGLADLRREVTE